MLRTMCLVLATLAILTALVMTHNSAKASPDMQTITLNTGYNHANQSAFPIGALDAFWTVTQDPIAGTSEPRSANAINKHAAWQPAQQPPNSQWISYTGNGATGIKQGPYIYQKCFCLTKALWQNKDAIQQSTLDLSIRADDNFYVGLNQMPTPGSNLLTQGGGVGAFNGPPAVLKITGNKLLQLLKPGRNCLVVRVDDIGSVITGFNLVGSLTTTGIDGIAQGPKVAGQFNACSACKNSKSEFGPAVQNGLTKLSN
ncbi:MAG: hypothetical protein WAQ99_07205 [Pyrinomonadaceae bacterium]